MPGAMIHANYIEALLDRTGTFNPIPDAVAEALETSMVIGLALVAALEIHVGFKWGAFFAGLTLSILLTYVLLQNLGLFLDFLIPLSMIVIHTVVEEILENKAEVHHLKRHRKELPHDKQPHSG
jgi:CHASE2 domain-containing sensor protein